MVPLLRVLSPVVPFGRCFLQHPYQRALTLVNDSDVPGCYGLLPQVCLCSSSSQTLPGGGGLQIFCFVPLCFLRWGLLKLLGSVTQACQGGGR